MICRHCGYEYERETVGFKTTCENCDEYLHSCFQCSLFDVRTSRCRSLTTEPVSDRIKNNYCEEFVKNTDLPQGKDLTVGQKPKRGGDYFNALFRK